MTRVVNIHHGSRYDVYVGRPGKGKPGPFGNPIQIGRQCQMCGRKHGRDPALIRCYERWLLGRLACDPAWREKVRELAGKTLGCFCVRADGTGLCHAIPLARAADLLASGLKVTAEALRAEPAHRTPAPTPQLDLAPPRHTSRSAHPFAVSSDVGPDDARILIVVTDAGRKRARFERGADGSWRCTQADPALGWMRHACEPVGRQLRARALPHWWIAA